MRDPDFKFRQFSIWQDQCAMKVGTDSVLLGAWADITRCKTILDIGTGTGILALIAAQRNPEAQITAVEIDASAAAQAESNIRESPWKDRIHVINTDIRSYDCPNTFDAILCNPPYFTKSLHSPDASRNGVRHDDTLSLDDLASIADKLLTEDGEMHLILPADTFSTITGIVSRHGLQLHGITSVCTGSGRPPKRTMLSLGRKFSNKTKGVIYLEDSNGRMSDEYRNLVKSFYLNV